MTPEPRATPHSEMMRALQDRIGPFPDGGAQGQAAKWMVSQGFTAEEVGAELDKQLDEKKRGKRVGRVSLLTVQKEIGAQHVGRPSDAEYINRSEEQLTSEEARELYDALIESDAEGFRFHIEMLKRLYRFV